MKSGSILNLTCPYNSTTEPLIWRGPPNFTTYSINNNINVDNIEAKGRVAITGNFEYGLYILSVQNFSREDAGLYRCDTAVNGRTTDHLIKVRIAGSINWNKKKNEKYEKNKCILHLI